jgi:hypothetical protein
MTAQVSLWAGPVNVGEGDPLPFRVRTDRVSVWAERLVGEHPNALWVAAGKEHTLRVFEAALLRLPSIEERCDAARDAMHAKVKAQP